MKSIYIGKREIFSKVKTFLNNEGRALNRL